MECRTCTILKEARNKLFEDNEVVALLSDRPATIGHILVVPKEHVPIFEHVPDATVARMFQVANRLSTICFDVLGAMGTNILLNNGIAAGQDENHVMLHVIPRRENDAINFLWQPKQATDDELSTIELLITEAGKPEKPQQVEAPQKSKPVEDYLLRSLRRIP